MIPIPMLPIWTISSDITNTNANTRQCIYNQIYITLKLIQGCLSLTHTGVSVVVFESVNVYTVDSSSFDG